MALDWNQEVSVDMLKDLLKGRKGGGGAGASGYPSKTTMNLFQGDKQTMNLRKLIIVSVVSVVALALFLKFGVFDQLGRLSQKEAELAQQQELVLAAASASGDYADVKQKYDAYTATYGTASVDAIMVLDMVEQNVKPVTAVSAIVLSDSTLTLTLYNVPLNTVGDLAKTLESQPLVATANVTTATTQNAEGQNTVSTIVCTLVGSTNEG